MKELFRNFIKGAVFMINLFKSVVTYVFLWGFKRKNWKTVRQYFAIAEELSKFAKKEKIAKNIGWLAKRFDDLTKNYSDEDTKRAATEISSAKGILNEVKLGYEVGGAVSINVGPIETKYDPRNGDFKFGLKL